MKKILKSIKYRFNIKGSLLDLLNIKALITSFSIIRDKRFNLSSEKIRLFVNKVESQIDLEKALLLASEIWRGPLKEKLQKVKIFIKNNDIDGLKEIFENLFKTDLMQGAVSHHDKISKLSRISQGTRFYKRYKLLKTEIKNKEPKLIEKLFKVIHSDNYNFGRPLIYKDIYKFNIEFPDELYFCLFITDFLKEKEFNEIVFIGDGAGLLSPLVIESINYYNKINETQFRIIDFLHFSLITALRNNKENVIINLPEKLHKYHKKKVLKGDLPSIKGSRLIINQDSFPEMKKVSLSTYLKNTADETTVISYNQLAQEAGKNHSDYLLILKELGYKNIIIKKSKLRSNYFMSVFFKESI